MDPLLVLIFVLICAVNKIHGENVTVSTTLGKVIGNLKGDYIEFKGIPYTANIPTRNYRFTESVIKTSNYSNNIYDATYYRYACIQHDFFIPINQQSEDCLHLNVFTPNIDTNGSISGELLPVLVWIHGGSFLYQSGAIYDPELFMIKSNVIIVIINYRLGFLGFLSTKSMFNETNGRTTGGMNGLNDQIIALQWIHNYIADYGGNPDKVTIFGESAGGFSVCFLSLIPLAAGLFDQIIIQSGHCSVPFASPATTETGLSISLSTLSSVGLMDNMTILRSANVSVLRTVASSISPSVDGYLLTETTHNMLVNNDFTLNANKVIIGSTSADTLLIWPWFFSYGVNIPPTNEDEFDKSLKLYIDDEDKRDLIKNTHYPLADFPPGEYEFDGVLQEFSSTFMQWSMINADVCFKCSGIWYLERLINNGAININDLYLYNFIGPQETVYVSHGGDVVYLFPDIMFTAEFLGVVTDDALSNLMVDSWVNFGIYGIPNSSITSEQWIPYGINETCMVFGSDIDGINSNYNLINFYSKEYRNGVCDFWINDIGWDIISELCMDTLTTNTTYVSTTTSEPADSFAARYTPLFSILFIVLSFLG